MYDSEGPPASVDIAVTAVGNFVGLDFSFKSSKLKQNEARSARGVYVTLYLHTYQVRVTVGDSGLCCCTRVTYFER